MGKFSRKSKIAYSVGSLSAALSYQAFAAYIAYFYERIVGLSVDYFSLAWAIYGVWNAINDPLAGFISDRTRTRWGRRIPYMVFGAVPLGIFFALVWSPPTGSAQFYIFVYATTMMCLFDGLYTFVILAWTSLFPEMYPSKEERGEVSGYRLIFSIVGLILAFLFPPIIGEKYGWWVMGIIMGGITALGVLISVAGSAENLERLKKQEELPLKEGIITTLKNKPFLHFVFANLSVQYSYTLAAAVLPLYAELVLGLSQAMVGLPLLVIILVAMFSVPLWNYLYKKTDGRRTLIFASVILGISLIPYLFINTFTEAIIIGIPTGVGLGGTLFISDPLISETIDYDEYLTGKRREGAYYGMNALIIRLAVVMSAVTLGVVQNSTGFVPGTPIQPPSAIYGIRLLVSVFPLIGVICAIIAIKGYSIRRAELEKLRKS